jgi:hypothetical protein
VRRIVLGNHAVGEERNRLWQREWQPATPAGCNRSITDESIVTQYVCAVLVPGEKRRIHHEKFALVHRAVFPQFLEVFVFMIVEILAGYILWDINTSARLTTLKT